MWPTVLLHSRATARTLRSGSLVSTGFSVWSSTRKCLSTIHPLLSMIDCQRKIGPSAIFSMLRSHTSSPCVLESTPLKQLQGTSLTQSKPTAALEIVLKNSVLFKLGVKANELKVLLAQAACHAPATLNQLVMAAILAKGDEKPTSTFVGKVILNASTKRNDGIQKGSPFVYCVTDPPMTLSLFNCLKSPNQKVPWPKAADIRQPPEHLADKFGAACFHCGRLSQHSPFNHPRPPSALGSHYQRDRVLQVQFAEHHSVDKVLIDSSASIHLSDSPKFATDLGHTHLFCIFFANSNSSITITQMVTLRIPVKGGNVVIHNVSYSDRVSGTILSMRRLCRAEVFPFFVVCCYP
ncbi:hypothetical protein O181_008003 [Austropuccinia psidii MF-1]|uniref:Uncharacterized protein n=1 Tax=Austropuccinia psidii MF-1 TaxID=1389203 RepID=A0A9Q3BNA6_9BASI|nr:hypothetical protein [Austropuccinia psidii MF-1]